MANLCINSLAASPNQPGNVMA